MQIRGIKYRYDTMNEDEAFKRVRIRKILLPLLKDFNPRIIETLAKTTFLLQDDFEAIEKIKKMHLPGFEKLNAGEKPESLADQRNKEFVSLDPPKHFAGMAFGASRRSAWTRLQAFGGNRQINFQPEKRKIGGTSE